MARKVDETVYVARSTGVVQIGDTMYTYVARKTRVRAGHPLLKAMPAAFRAEAADTEHVVALAAPDAPGPAVVRTPEPGHELPPETAPEPEPVMPPDPEPEA